MTSLKLYNIIKHRLHVCFKESYNRKVPPFTVHPLSGSMVPVQVEVSTTLMNVLAVSEFTHTIDLKLGRHLIISRIHSILLMENSPFGISKFYIKVDNPRHYTKLVRKQGVLQQFESRRSSECHVR